MGPDTANAVGKKLVPKGIVFKNIFFKHFSALQQNYDKALISFLDAKQNTKSRKIA
jgi:hypothetical protein